MPGNIFRKYILIIFVNCNKLLENLNDNIMISHNYLLLAIIIYNYLMCSSQGANAI